MESYFIDNLRTTYVIKHTKTKTMYAFVKNNIPYVTCFDKRLDAKHVVKSLTMYNSIHKRNPAVDEIYICSPDVMNKWDTSKNRQVNCGLFEEEMKLVDVFEITQFRNIGVSLISLDYKEDVKNYGISFINFAPVDDLESIEEGVKRLEDDFFI
jgi:hypothetical protein